MMTFAEYKEQLLDYLRQEKELMERDIELHQDLSDEDKVEQGYLIKECEILSSLEEGYELNAPANNTKLRAGDKVVLCESRSNTRINATVIENFFNQLSIKTNVELNASLKYDVNVQESVFLDPLISLLDKLEEGASGSYYLEMLCGIESPETYGFSPLRTNRIHIPTALNDKQRETVLNVTRCPSLYCIQGPPGTGKTAVLATIARAFSESGKEVLVVSNTHQAVNNALNTIANNPVPVAKIGETLKAQELDDRIQKAKSFSEYLRNRPRRVRGQNGVIVGMTLHAAIINVGLQSSGFSPSVVLVDEAGQIPLTFGAAIGTFGAGSVIFIGDDRQMPPIFHPELEKNELSVSVFSHVTNLYPSFKTVLDITYRMNHDITKFVSKSFYEPYGISLKSIREPKYDNSIEVHSLPIDRDNLCEDFNPDEAKLVSEIALKWVKKGLNVAVVTPFRKQVNCIKSFMNQLFADVSTDTIPLVDTVERLQGQSVDVIIISTAVSSLDYYYNLETFILEPHRLNVMCSRAKEKVIFVKSDIVTLPDIPSVI